MRIWHEQLIPKLCRQHLLACWREGLGCYKIITENKKGYRNHPAVKEFEDAPSKLWERLASIRHEMINRGYNPKHLPPQFTFDENGKATLIPEKIKEWQDLKTQIEWLKTKKCNCSI
jgi:uncharacterized protein (TIGR02328 family)